MICLIAVIGVILGVSVWIRIFRIHGGFRVL